MFKNLFNPDPMIKMLEDSANRMQKELDDKIQMRNRILEMPNDKPKAKAKAAMDAGLIGIAIGILVHNMPEDN